MHKAETQSVERGLGQGEQGSLRAQNREEQEVKDSRKEAN